MIKLSTYKKINLQDLLIDYILIDYNNSVRFMSYIIMQEPGIGLSYVCRSQILNKTVATYLIEYYFRCNAN